MKRRPKSTTTIFDPDRQLEVVNKPVKWLEPYAGNPRIHDDRHVSEIAASYVALGIFNPIITDEKGVILAGHGRREAAIKLGLKTVPVIVIAGLSNAQKRAVRLADNKLTINGRFDADRLRVELKYILKVDRDLAINATGFSTTEIDLTLGLGKKPPRDDPADALPDAGPIIVTRSGDLWLLGDHRLFCGDSRRISSFAKVVGREHARMVFSDAPYNVPVAGFVGGLGKVQHTEFVCASGEMSKAEFIAFLRLVFENSAEFSVDGALHYQCMDWRHMGEMLAAGEQVYSELKNLCVWGKDRASMGSHYRSQHELIFVWKYGTAPHVNTVELGKNGRYRTNLWSYPAPSRTGPNAELAWHPTVKSVTMIMDAIMDSSRQGETVLDPFGGSGSTLIAAEKTGRRARLIEYEPKYCDVTLRRWQDLTGKQAVLARTNQTFDEVLAAATKAQGRKEMA